MTRVAVFIDYQNMYHGVRDAFGWRDEPHMVGQVDPYRLGTLLCHLGKAVDPERKLEYVKAFRGEPSTEHSPKGHSACQRQVRRWNQHPLVEGVTRQLDYSVVLERDYRGNPTRRLAREKGIDVLLALAIVGGAMRDEYDVAVLCSRDSDLMPALEETRRLGKRVEMMCWGRARPWVVGGRNVWCHHLQPHQYDQVSDETDYRPQEP